MSTQCGPCQVKIVFEINTDFWQNFIIAYKVSENLLICFGKSDLPLLGQHLKCFILGSLIKIFKNVLFF